MASPDTMILLIVDYHAAIGGKTPVATPCIRPSQKAAGWSYYSLGLTAIFQVNLGEPVFIEAMDDGGGEWWQQEL